MDSEFKDCIKNKKNIRLYEKHEKNIKYLNRLCCEREENINKQ